MNPDKERWVSADFNGVMGDDLLCLTHSDSVKDRAGNVITLEEGMTLTAFDPDADEHGRPDDLFASGRVEPAPDWLRRHGSKWVLRIDDDGIRNESDLPR